MPVTAAADVDSVVRQFWNEFATGDRYWWWPTAVWVDPNQVIADDDEGHLYRVPFTTDSDGDVTFGDPIRVVTQYRDVPTSDSQPAVAAARPTAVFAAATDVRPRDRVRANRNEGEQMPLAPTAVLERLGLPEDATEDQILAALDAEETGAGNGGENETGSETETETETTETETQTETATAAVAASVAVDPETFRQMQEDARAGREAREQQIAASRQQFVDAAIASGKFPPSRRDHYLALMSRDDQGTREFIDGLADGLIPTSERGAAPANASAAVEELGWFPQFSKPKEVVSNG